MKTIQFISILGLASSLLFSCKKDDCVLPEENINTGAIVDDSYVYGIQPKQGMDSREIYRENVNDGAFKVSFDKGVSYGQIDFSKYLVMNFPVQVSCRTGFERDVVISSSGNVTYTLNVINCPGGCEELYWVQNWVLVPKFPENYNVTYVKR